VFRRNSPHKVGNIQRWSQEELQDSRRIIGIKSVAHGDVIEAECYHIAPPDYHGDMITISCIFANPNPEGEIQHDVAGKCIFTSVDIIVLMERLVRQRFDVQEKNRIRRNLEGFNPYTVKKEGPTTRLFAQLMGYNQPMCRKIEKDIKVFLWPYITKAIKKILQMYKVNGSVPLGPAADPDLPSMEPIAAQQTIESEGSQKRFDTPKSERNMASAQDSANHFDDSIPFYVSGHDASFSLSASDSLTFQTAMHLPTLATVEGALDEVDFTSYPDDCDQMDLELYSALVGH